MGIRKRMYPSAIHVHESGRVLVAWHAVTTGEKAALRWAIIAPSSSGYKRKDVEGWSYRIESRVQQLMERLEYEGLLTE